MSSRWAFLGERADIAAVRAVSTAARHVVRSPFWAEPGAQTLTPDPYVIGKRVSAAAGHMM